MIINDVPITIFIDAIKKKYKIMLVTAVLIGLIGAYLSYLYIIEKEGNYMYENITIQKLEFVPEEKINSNANLEILINKISQINTYITQIMAYSNRDDKNNLIELQEILNENIAIRAYEYKYHDFYNDIKSTFMHIFEQKFMDESYQHLNYDVDIDIEEKQSKLEVLYYKTNEVIEETIKIGDTIVKENNLIVHDGSKVFDNAPNKYVYIYYVEKLDIRDTIIANCIFFILFGIAIGYVIGLGKYIKDKEHIKKN